MEKFADRRNYGAIFFYAISILSGILISVLLFAVPLSIDDLWFLDGIYDAPSPSAFIKACQVLSERLSTDTGRFGAIISPLFLALFPKWIYNILTGIIFCMLIVGSCRLARIRPGTIWSWLLLLFCVIGLPWYDYLTVLTYGINYIWAATLAVWAANLILSKRRLTTTWMILGLLLCFIAGWMHEGFGIPLSAAALSLVIWPGLKRQRIWMTVAVILGTSMTAASPAVWNRLFYVATLESKQFPTGELVIHFGPLAIMLLLYLLSLILSFSKRRKKLSDYNSTVVFFSVFILVSSVVAIIFYCGPRITTATVLFAGIASVRLISPLVRPLPQYWRFSGGAIITFFLIAHFPVAIAEQRVLKKEYEDIVKKFQASSNGQVFKDVQKPKISFSLFKTTVRQFNEHIPRTFFSRYYDPSGSKELSILPPSLQGFSLLEAVPSDHTPGLYMFKGLMIMKREPKGYKATIILGDGSESESRYRFQPFQTSDGETYFLITPHVQVLNPKLQIRDAIIE